MEASEQAADAAPGAGGRALSFLQRAPLRRRLQFLRRQREVALRDLGGFVFEEHRQGQQRPELRSAKLEALSTIERERAQLEQALGERQELAVLREPGLGACAKCGTIHGSEANYCPRCGTPTSNRQASESAA
jgi:hypothetical protein